ALGRVRGEHVEGQPTGSHEDEAAGTFGVVEREADRGAPAQGVADQVRGLDAQLVEEVFQRGGGEGEVVALDGRLVGLAVPGLIDDEGAEVSGEGGQVVLEVGHPGRTGAAAVQHDRYWPLAGFVVVKVHVVAPPARTAGSACPASAPARRSSRTAGPPRGWPGRCRSPGPAGYAAAAAAGS